MEIMYRINIKYLNNYNIKIYVKIETKMINNL